MKRCPHCHSVFDDNLDYCTNDGTGLINENFVLPSEASLEAEEETIIHHQPIKIKLPNQPQMPPVPANYQIPPSNPVIVEKKGSTGKYFLFLLIGLFLGGGLVLGLGILIYSQLNSSNSGKPAEKVQISGGKHSERNKTRKDSDFNGFVLSESANLRSAPNSTVLDELPQNDRLNIQERDAAWYRVVCEHGVSGWMHGNTIRFNDDETPF